MNSFNKENEVWFARINPLTKQYEAYTKIEGPFRIERPRPPIFKGDSGDCNCGGSCSCC